MEPLLTTSDLAALLKVHVQTVRIWWHDGKLPKPVRPSAHSPRWRPADVQKWLDEEGRSARRKTYGRTAGRK